MFQLILVRESASLDEMWWHSIASFHRNIEHVHCTMLIFNQVNVFISLLTLKQYLFTSNRRIDESIENDENKQTPFGISYRGRSIWLHDSNVIYEFPVSNVFEEFVYCISHSEIQYEYFVKFYVNISDYMRIKFGRLFNHFHQMA